MKKRILSLLLALVMLAAMLAGCGGTTNGSTPAGTQGSGNQVSDNQEPGSTEGSTANYTKVDENGNPVVSIMLPGYYGGEMTDARDTDGAVQQAVIDYTGVDPEWTFATSEGYGDLFNMQLLDKDSMPMIMAFTGDISTTIIQAAQNGAFWDLTPFIESGDYPNLATTSETLREVLTVNGSWVAIPKMRETGRYGLSYRGDWAAKLGIDVPETVEDVYNMLYAFTYDDPDGNGKNDTYGLEVNGSYLGWMDVIFTWFGCGYKWVEKDGDLVPVHETEEYKEACEWIRKLTVDGLIRPDWASVGTDGWGEETQKGNTGAFVDTLDGGGRRQWRYYITNSIPSVVAGTTASPDPENPDTAWSVMVGTINNATAAVQVYNGGFLITKAGAKTEDDVRACLAFLDKMNDKEMRALANFGIEGVSYHMEDGFAVTDIDDVNNLPSQGLNQAIAYLPFTLDDEIAAKSDAPADACTAAQTAAREYAVMNPAMAYLGQSETYVNDNATISTIITDACVRFCANVDTWEDFEAAIAEWESRGGAQIKEEVNALYHANKG